MPSSGLNALLGGAVADVVAIESIYLSWVVKTTLLRSFLLPCYLYEELKSQSLASLAWYRREITPARLHIMMTCDLHAMDCE